MRMKKIVGLVMGCAVAMLASASGMANKPAGTTEGVTGGAGTILDGTMNVQIVNGCYALIEGVVNTPNTGGTVGAALNFWDDGNFLTSIPLTFAANGSAQSYCQVYQQLVPVLQGAAGVGIYLEDAEGLASIQTFASVGDADLSNICTGPAPVCVAGGGPAVPLPTGNRIGFALLVFLLVGAAGFWIARRRSALAR